MKRLRSWLRWLPRSLQFQLLTRSLAVLAAVLVLVGVLQYVFMKSFVYQNKASTLLRQIDSVPGDMWERFDSIARRGRNDPFLFFPGTSVAYIEANGTFHEISSDKQSGSIPRLEADAYDKARNVPRNKNNDYEIVVDDAGTEQLVVLGQVRSFNRSNGGVVQISTRTAPMKEDLLRQLLLFIGLALFALVLGLLTFRPVLRKTLVPLSNIVGTMERMDSARLNERLSEEHGQTEIDRLAHSFNRMLGRLEASFLAEQEAKEQMRRFVADASHELRTPLTSIHGFLEVLLRGAASNPEQLRKSLESMHGESERMNKLVRDLLTLARLDRAPTVQWAEADLSSIVEEMEPQLRLLADRRKVEFDLHFGSYRMLDIDKIKQVILNLFHNSIQHTDPERGKIRLLVRPDTQGIELSVADNGSGISADHLPHLFERFYRIDSSRTRKSGGAGLGLSITKSIVDLHGGLITVDSRVGEGTVFRVRLPDNTTKVLPIN